MTHLSKSGLGHQNLRIMLLALVICMGSVAQVAEAQGHEQGACRAVLEEVQNQ